VFILFLHPSYTAVKTLIHRLTGIVCERVHMVVKEEEEKKPWNKQFAVTGTWRHNLWLQSQACYPWGHSALPESLWIVPRLNLEKFSALRWALPLSLHSSPQTLLTSGLNEIICLGGELILDNFWTGFLRDLESRQRNRLQRSNHRHSQRLTPGSSLSPEPEVASGLRRHQDVVWVFESRRLESRVQGQVREHRKSQNDHAGEESLLLFWS